MDPRRFDELVRALPAGTRRGLVAAVTAGLVGTRLGSGGAAKNKNKKRKKKPLDLNGFGCVNVGDACKGNDANCCSGICGGRKPKKGERDRSRCLAHDASTCIAGQREIGCGGSVEIDCTTTMGREGACNTTTGNAGYCTVDGECFVCTKDTDCIPFCGPQAACIACVPGCASTGGTACVGPTECAFPPT